MISSLISALECYITAERERNREIDRKGRDLIHKGIQCLFLTQSLKMEKYIYTKDQEEKKNIR